ncbi:MAG: hypothetical protein KGZ83_04215 [Sulfuricella sp.]|nr:hypothetical protein [Sulfuricella sp.]
MSRKVIYIGHAHLSEKMERDWYINYLRARNVSVEYWDVLPLLFGEIDEPGAINANYLYVPKTYDAIEAMLCHPENIDAYFVMLVNYAGSTVKLYRLLGKHHVRMIYILWAAFPGERSGRAQQVLHGLISNPLTLVKKAFNAIKARIYKNLKFIQPFEIVFAAGQVLMRSEQHSAKMVPINFCDYDQYMRVMSEGGGRLVNERYAVFLDVYLTNQSDLVIFGLKAINPSEYLQSLNHFFELLELKYGVKVVVAAHPKANYNPETFNGRDIFCGVTPELVRDAEFVISHHSASVSYAVLNRKPIIFVYTEEMNILYGHTPIIVVIQSMADFLGAPIYNTNEITECDQISIGDVDSIRYEKFKYDYLTTHESEHTTTQEIFWREISAR